MRSGMQNLVNSKFKGFTLIEMVIVVLLVGIMAAIAIPKFVNLTDQAKQNAYNTGLGSMKSSIGIYLAKNTGAWPTATQMIANMESTATCGTSGGADPTVFTIVGIEGTYQTSLDCADVMTNMAVITGTQTWL